ncbi:MAG: hypothetical protein IT430_02490 [Phycisphaerales bacterium]|nr:hypothetical protein [Phycisphaerales bacterium]
MPELPDILVYLDALRHHAVGKRLEDVIVRGPSLLRSVEPPLDAFDGRVLTGVSRLGKRMVLHFDEMALVIHLMIAGRLIWRNERVRPKRRNELAAFRFEHGTLILTEAGTKHRATLTAVGSADELKRIDRGGLDLLTCSRDDLAERLRSENRTLKRALTDPRLIDGVGNAYSDEILHEAQLSPFVRTGEMTDEQIAGLHDAARVTLEKWSMRLSDQFDAGRVFPGRGQITAFRKGFAVHGRFNQPCPRCGSPVQRIVYAENEMNYCARCQTGGRILADRSLSRLLRDDWPRTIEELEGPDA